MRPGRALGILVAAPAALLGMAGARAQVQVTVDGTPVAFTGQPPVEQEGRVLVPLRGVLERLGAFVRYDPATRTVTAIREATNITLPVDSRRALVNERVVILDTPAFAANGSVLVPLRFVSEALGARVTWDVGTRTVAIETAKASPAQPTPRPTPPPALTVVTGRVRAVYPDLSPRRIVVRVRPGGGSGAGQDRTIPLGRNAAISVRRADGPAAIPLTRVRVGDTVEVRETSEGVAASVVVIARAESAAIPPVVKPAPTPAVAETFKGEFLEAKRVEGDGWVLKMTDGRLIEVGENVLILYGGDKITVDDLRSGDPLTISVDPKTRRGTRVVVTVQ